MLANAFSHLLSLRMRKVLSGFGRTRWAGTATAYLERPGISVFQLLTQIRTFLHVKIFHIRDRSLNMSSLVDSTLPSVLLSIDLVHRTHHLLFVSAAARDEGVRRCEHARCVRSVHIVRAPLLYRSRSVEFSGEIGSPLVEQPSVQIRNVLRNSNLDNKRRPPAGFG